ncbi:hypothetical protein CB0940_08069 [Cercospora beticola]|uniref:Uncharacterized protein n=1 Tax=Cercospora beticola TaxID=122368 RepID=A0A2G5HNH5_CERBT|nr:hypothetical protein CB0940_08069 [Cercospora beticola]PIA94111.1 hypothetical protein CB0940_08069 [Cercospora beticola]WPB04628.1 hypothetical protein RHO25_009274 [Cercospora beticola]CAK1364374.1 unnamed protein product [Cercospora beticola]
MGHRDGGYSSDDSTLYSRGSRHRGRRSSPTDYNRRPRRSRRYASPSRDEKKGSSTAGTFVKLGIGVALVQIVATCFSAWMKDKQEADDRHYRHEKRRAFEKAKAKRRREEEEYEKRRQREEDESDGREWDEREIIIREGRRIGYVPAENANAERDDSQDRQVRRIEAPPDDYYDYEHSDDDWEDERRRAPSVAARSRSRFGGRPKSVRDLRDDRSRSRPAERIKS